ncbi:MAG TPA: ACT domain-containing protein [Acidimicrobiales bacterium]|nr:ACT domain-containing protein [Acidimicrobiales bacterium]
MEHVALTAVGADQPGIVAAVTGVLVDLGCNLEDSTMSILRGQFAVLLVIAVPEGRGADAVEASLAPVADRLGLTIVVRPLPPGPGARGGGDSASDRSRGASGGEAGTEAGADGPGVEGDVYAFSVHGADRPGIVHRAAEALAEAGGNIIDLSTRLVGSDDQPVYVLTLTVGFDPGTDADAAATAVRQSVEAFGVQCHAHRVEFDVL